jgi:hypothetical protein
MSKLLETEFPLSHILSLPYTQTTLAIQILSKLLVMRKLTL